MKNILLCFLCSISFLTLAQDKKLISSTGFSSVTSYYTIDIAIGEVFIHDSNSGSYIFNEGILPHSFETPTFNSNIEISNVSVFPNPVESMIEISGIQPSANAKLLLYDINGKEIFNKPFNKCSYSLSSLKSGEYILIIKGESCNHAVKIIKK